MALPYGAQGLAAGAACGENFSRREPLAHGVCGIHKKFCTPFA
jgi:hypothetical protein